MDEPALSFIGSLLNKRSVSSLRVKTSTEHSVAKLLYREPSSPDDQEMDGWKPASHVLLEAWCKHANHSVQPLRLRFVL